MDQIDAVEANVVAPEAGRGQGIDWTRSLTFTTGDLSRHFKLEHRNLLPNLNFNLPFQI